MSSMLQVKKEHCTNKNSFNENVFVYFQNSHLKSIFFSVLIRFFLFQIPHCLYYGNNDNTIIIIIIIIIIITTTISNRLSATRIKGTKKQLTITSTITNKIIKIKQTKYKQSFA